MSARRHHYVPKFYLAGFTAEGTQDGRLFVVDQRTGKTWKSSPGGVAHERDFYRIDDADIDRYLVDGQVTQVAIAARDLNQEKLPSKSWVNEHVQYTHGYGVVVSPTNVSLGDGNPQFFVSDIPYKFAEVGERFLGSKLGRVLKVGGMG